MNMFEFIRKLVLAWNPDYTKVTLVERYWKKPKRILRKMGWFHMTL